MCIQYLSGCLVFFCRSVVQHRLPLFLSSSFCLFPRPKHCRGMKSPKAHKPRHSVLRPPPRRYCMSIWCISYCPVSSNGIARHRIARKLVSIGHEALGKHLFLCRACQGVNIDVGVKVYHEPQAKHHSCHECGPCPAPNLKHNHPLHLLWWVVG